MMMSNEYTSSTSTVTIEHNNNFDEDCRAFRHACHHGDLIKAKEVYYNYDESTNEQSRLLHFRDVTDHTPLHRAVVNGHHQIVAFLVLECDTNVNLKKKNGQTPLHEAVYKNDRELIRILLEGGADLECRDNAGSNVLAIAAEYGHSGLVRHLHDSFGVSIVEDFKYNNQSYTASPLFKAAEHNQPSIVRYLIHDCSADFYSRNSWGTSPVRRAAMNGHLDILKIFLEECDSDPFLDERFTAIVDAMKHKMPRCVNYIRHQCLAISRYRNTKNGDTTLHHVIRKHMAKSFVEWVFVSCPDHVNAINLDGNTPLHLACLRNNSEVVEFFLQKGSLVNTDVVNKRKKKAVQLTTEAYIIDLFDAFQR